MKEESHLKYIVGLGLALALAVTVWWQLSDLLCPPRGCRPRRDFLVNFFLVWMPAVITFMLTAGFTMMIWEKFERSTAETDATPTTHTGSTSSAAPANSPAADQTAQARAAYDRGYALLNGNNLEGAVREFNLAISLDPGDAYALMARGNAYAEMRWFEHAIADYDRAVALDAGNAAAHYNRGRTWQDLGDLHRALADFDTALRLRPDYMRALHARGIALQTLGENAHAIADFRQALALANDDATRQQLRSNLAALGAYP